MNREERRKKQEAKTKPYERVRTEAGHYNWSVDLIKPNKNQPRKYFAEEAMAGLRASIQEMGILNPIRIRVVDVSSGRATIVDGERRFRIAHELKMVTVPVFLDLSAADDVFKKSVVMNFCREDMSPVEIARALKFLMDRYGYNQTKVAEICGKSGVWVSNMLKYLRLGDQVTQDLQERKISPVIASVVSRFAKEKQTKMVQAIKQVEREKGRALTVQEAALSATKIAEEMKIQPEKTKYSRPPRSFATGKVETLIRQLENMTKSFKEFVEIDNQELQIVDGKNLEALNSEIKDFERVFTEAKEKMAVVY